MKRGWIAKSDGVVLYSALIILLTFIGWALINPDNMLEVIGMVFNTLTGGFGWAYLLAGFIFFIFALWLAFGPFGNVKLGKDDEKPKYSFFTWFAMIIACGYGVGLVYWCVAEPLSFLQAPPFGAAPMTPEAAERAMSQAFFHWGWIPWAIYMSVAAPAGYFIYRKGQPPHFSSFLRPLFGDKVEHKGFRLLDGFLVYGVIGGVTTATGLGILQLSGGLNSLFGIPINNTTYIVIGLCWAALFTASAVSGIDKGIKILSNINIPLCIAICIAVFILGPSNFIMNTTTTGLGDMLQNFFRMSFWTDSFETNFFPQWWTIFYWAWWIASAPSTGLFVAAVSRGRTLKEVVLVHLGAAPIATWLWYGTFGSTAIHMEFYEGAGLVESMNANGTGSTVFTMLQRLPMGGVLSGLFIVLVFIFLATTVDSYAYVCAQVTTKKECNPIEPPKPTRALWAVSIAALAIMLVLVASGEITGLQTSSLVASIAITIIMLLMMAAMIKSLYDEFGDDLKAKRKLVSTKAVYLEDEPVPADQAAGKTHSV